uniref:E3 ubiquitin-protein ligase CBL n=1 Tax=Macrostomum lignano TaxID=282301 RepID=A0A1I8HMT2_9PLAT
DVCDRSRPLEGKHLDGIYKRISKVIRFLGSVGLEVYQPFILETLPEIATKLRQVWSHYESTDRQSELSYNEYFRIFLESLDAKVRELKVLCRHNKAEMYNSNSKPRVTLIRMSMTLSYLFKDFKVFFPSNEFSEHFRVTKQDASDWWSRNFGNRVLVPWHEFQFRFGSEHCISSFEEAQSLKRDIDITLNDYVSKFEFDVFTRLFMPWSNILNTWKMLAVKHPGYVNMTYEEVKKCLEELCDKPASFVFRRSCTKLGFWSIGFVSNSRKVNQTVIRDGKSIVEALVEGAEQRLYLYPRGMDPSAAPDLQFLLSCRAKEQIAVSAEEFEIYSNMDSSFELCKICSENNKDLKLEPCGHLLCRACFKDWSQKLNRHDKTSSCPAYDLPKST